MIGVVGGDLWGEMPGLLPGKCVPEFDEVIHLWDITAL